MSTFPNVTVAGVFADAEQARRAVEALRRAGVRDEEIHVAPRRVEPAADAGCRSEEGVTVGTGAGVGMLTGAALGGLAAGGLPGMLVAGAAGGLLGAFIDLGIPEDAACFYEDQRRAGRTLVLVRSAGQSAEALDLLSREGAQEVRVSAAGERAQP